MRTKSRRPIATCLLLVGATFLLAGCGDEGSHLPAGMTGSSTMYASAGSSSILDSDPGPLDAGVRSGVDDPVLADYDLVDQVSALSNDDPLARAAADWNDTEGSLGGLDSGYDDFDDFDDPMYDDGYGGYGGYGDGWGDGLYGYGNNLLGAAAYGGVGVAGYGGYGGFVDPGFGDPGIIDGGIDDPGFIDGGFDAGFVDAGMDVGFVDAGVDAGFDPGFADVGGFDVGGFDAGIVDPGFADVGGFDAGIVF